MFSSSINKRYHGLRSILLLFLGCILVACSSFEPVAESAILASASPIPPTASAAITFAPSSTPSSTNIPTPASTREPTRSPATSTPTAVPTQGCLEREGQMQTGQVDSEILSRPLEYKIYLPPCYEADSSRRYPVLYLIHGLGGNADQWDRLGIDEALSQLVTTGKISPFLIVLPYNRDNRRPPLNHFGEAMIDELIPEIDATYRTQADRLSRAVGGLSRGAGWAVHLGLSHWELFSIIGAHSLAVFRDNTDLLLEWLDEIPKEALPRIYLDIGNKDPELQRTREFEDLLNARKVPHAWYLFSGYHEEAYWSAHVDQYLTWYAQQWKDGSE